MKQMTRFLTCVHLTCDGALLGHEELLLAVQDFLLPLVELGPAEALRVGGSRLISLWSEAATLQGAGLDEFTGAAMFEALKRGGADFLEHAIKANVSMRVWTSVANYTVGANDRAMLEMLHDRIPHIKAGNALDVAVWKEDIGLLDWIYVRNFGGSRVNSHTIARATHTGNIEVIRWLLKVPEVRRKDTAVRRAMNRAAKLGQLQVMRLLYEDSGGMWSPEAFSAALVNSHYDTAEWMLQVSKEQAAKRGYESQNPFINVNEALQRGFAEGDLVLLEWLRERDLLTIYWSGWRALTAGHVHVLDYIVEHFPEDWKWSLRFHASTAEGGSIKGAQWALKHDLLDISAAVVHRAAEHGHIEFITWYTTTFEETLQPQQARESVQTAAERGHLACVEFLVDNGYGFVTQGAIHGAAVNGHLEVAQWLAARYILAEADPLVDRDTHPGRDAGEPGVLLLNLEDAMNQAAADGHLEVVKWLHSMLFNFDASTIREASANGHLGVVKYLVAHTHDNDIAGALEAAGQRGHFAVVKYLLSCFPQADDFCEFLVNTAQKAGHVNIVRWIKIHE